MEQSIPKMSIWYSVSFLKNKYNELYQASDDAFIVLLSLFGFIEPKFDFISGSRAGTLMATLVYVILAAPVTVAVAVCR